MAFVSNDDFIFNITSIHNGSPALSLSCVYFYRIASPPLPLLVLKRTTSTLLFGPSPPFSSLEARGGGEDAGTTCTFLTEGDLGLRLKHRKEHIYLSN